MTLFSPSTSPSQPHLDIRPIKVQVGTYVSFSCRPYDTISLIICNAFAVTKRLRGRPRRDDCPTPAEKPEAEFREIQTAVRTVIVAVHRRVSALAVHSPALRFRHRSARVRWAHGVPAADRRKASALFASVPRHRDPR